MDLRLTGRTALVTGASRGIGLGVARILMSEGCHVHLASRSEDALEAAADDLRLLGPGQVAAHPCDLGVAQQRHDLVSACGAVDILVNNAGAVPQGSILDVDIAALVKAWELKLFGYLELTRDFYRVMSERGSGVIVNVIGTAGSRPRADYIAGSMANAGLVAMTRALGSESLDRGVRVVGVSPGHTETDRQVTRWRALATETWGDPDRWRDLLTNLPAGRLGRVDEVASLVALLCSDRSGYTSGTVMTVDGGLSFRTRAPWES